MINLNLAWILTNLAEIKKIGPGRKDDVFNTVRAARSLKDDPGIIEKIQKGEGRQDFPGIDEKNFALISEYLKSGKISEYEKLQELYSRDLLSLIRITGLGSKRMFSIYDTFKITNLNQLKNIIFNTASCKDLINNAGLAEDTLNDLYIARLKRSIEYFESLRGKIPRGSIDFFMSKIVDSISKLKGIKKIITTGSVRRKKSWIRDIDIMILPSCNDRGYNAEESANLLKKIQSLDFIQKLIGTDPREDNISARFKTAHEIDLEVIISSNENWALDSIYTTGSKKHLKKLEDIAKKLDCFANGRISFKTRPAEEISTEKAIYNRLGLQYIPPELREANGEIGLAAANSLPVLVELKDIKGDLHIHSSWSDGLIEFDEMIKKARKYNYQYIAISDHSESNYYGKGLDAKKLMERNKSIDRLNSRTGGLEILKGSEIDITGTGKFDYNENIMGQLDIAIGSQHSSYSISEERNTSRAVSALENKNIDFIAHPTGMVFRDRAPVFINIDRLVESAKENNKALEINSYFMRLDLDDVNARKAGEVGAKLVINTDSHRPGNIDMIVLGVDIARRAGLEKKDILNTFTLKELAKWKKNRP